MYNYTRSHGGNQCELRANEIAGFESRDLDQANSRVLYYWPALLLAQYSCPVTELGSKQSRAGGVLVHHGACYKFLVACNQSQ